jgi:hypothetical protein
MLRQGLCSLTCALALAAAAPSADILKGGANLLHRAPLPQPVESERVEGTIVIEATLNERGLVNDARVISGPAAFRKTSLKSVLDWHYGPGTPSPVEIMIHFRALGPASILLNGQPFSGETTPQPSPAPPKMDAGILARIQFVGRAAELEQSLRDRLPIREGDSFQTDVLPLISDAVRQTDEHLAASYRMIDFDGIRRQFELRISFAVPVE